MHYPDTLLTKLVCIWFLWMKWPLYLFKHYYHPILSKVKWYGSDGTALNEKLIRNHESALFAVNTSFSNPIYLFQNIKNKKLGDLLEEIDQKYMSLRHPIPP